MIKELCPNCDNYSKCNRSYRDAAGYCDGFLNHKRKRMITEQELKDKCTPEFIRRMTELAEGFEVYIPVNNINPEYSKFMFTYVDKITWQKRFYHISDAIVFSTLLHRAVEGWNKKDVCRPIQILCNCISFITDEDDPASIEYGYDDNQYQPESLTQAECAILHCLLDVFKQEERDE